MTGSSRSVLSARPAAFPPRRAGWVPLRAPAHRTPEVRGRLIALVVVLSLGFAAVGLRLIDLQALSAGKYAVIGRDQRLHPLTLPAPRGAIYDRNRAALAVSVPRTTVWADPQMVDDPAGAARALAPVLGRNESDLRALLTTPSSYVTIARRVDDATAEAVKALPPFNGILLKDEPTRMAPAGPVGSSVVGSVDSDQIGYTGLEGQYEDLLAGKPGQIVVERDPSGRDIPNGVRQQTAPVSGKSLVLTIDRDLQYFAEQALADQITSTRSRSGIAIVMDPRTGEILAMANVVAGANGKPPQPADYNKAVIDVYEPGSVNKIVTMSAALDTHTVKPSDVFSVPDRITVAGTQFVDAEPHSVGQWTPTDVLAESSNAGAILIAQQVGRTGLDRYLRAFGLDDDSGLDFPLEAAGIVPDLDNWSGTTLPTLAIGYGLAVTPLQMLSAYNTIANGGVHVAPSLVRSEIDSRGRLRDGPEPESRRVVSADTAREVTAMLEAAVTHGTGRTAAIEGYTVAGKTGTARKAAGDYKEGAYVASFAGFFPAEAPRLSAIVVLDEPQPYTGALASGPVFAKIAQYAVRHYQVPPPQGGAEPAAATLPSSSATRP
ncbi:MAG: peptidoglycan D,D-transpeptidase FtsI family protein [Acidimicrobiales bacterium]